MAVTIVVRGGRHVPRSLIAGSDPGRRGVRARSARREGGSACGAAGWRSAKQRGAPARRWVQAAAPAQGSGPANRRGARPGACEPREWEAVASSPAGRGRSEPHMPP
eukprot:scaffold536_cov409-Prasinococcus_capsulatus_cf.AAC.7